MERQVNNMKGVLGILDCHNSCSLGELTMDRPLASVSFLGRYAICDFPLSNFCNSGIDNVGILVKEHQRSILKHLGNSMSWVNNTKMGHINVFYNEKGQVNPSYNTDLANLKENDWVIITSGCKYIVIQSADVITNTDLTPFIEEHIERGEKITTLYHEIDDADKQWFGGNTYEIDSDGYLISTKPNDGSEKKAKVALGTWIINRDALQTIFDESAKVSASWGLKEMMGYLAENGIFNIHCVKHEGYVRRMDSLQHYVDYSFELLNRDVAKQLFVPERPIYTTTHDTAPALYGVDSKVANSFVANGCVVEGEVENSIICRDVKVGKGAKVSNSILLSNVWVLDGANVDNVIIDKYSTVLEKHTIAGDKANLIYIRQGAKI